MTYLEGVYWDLDGTIANTELEAHLPAFNYAFNDFNLNWNWDFGIALVALIWLWIFFSIVGIFSQTELGQWLSDLS